MWDKDYGVTVHAFSMAIGIKLVTSVDRSEDLMFYNNYVVAIKV